MVTGDEWWRLLPPGTSGDALRVLATRGVRAFADGFVALLLPIYLVEIGFNALAVGAIVASTLVGTALLTLWVGLIANRHSRRMLLVAASVLMAATGAAFATVTAFWPLLVIAFVGTINPTSGDASIFQPLEQTVLTQTIAPPNRAVRPLQRDWIAGRCRRRVGGGHPGYRHRMVRLRSRNSNPRNVRGVWSVRRLVADLVPTSVERGGGGGWGAESTPGTIATVGLRALTHPLIFLGT
jgi:hypothetical protein